MRKADLILIGGVLLAAFLWLGYNYMTKESGAVAAVYIDGEKQAEYPLDEDIVVDLAGYEGGYNTLEIHDEMATVSKADCPDELCVHQSDIHYTGDSLVCLPHRVVVVIENGESRTVDGVAK